MRPKSLARDAARAANVPVYAVKSGSTRSLVRAIETLLGITTGSAQPSDSDDEEEEMKNHVVSLVSSLEPLLFLPLVLEFATSPCNEMMCGFLSQVVLLQDTTSKC